MVALSPAENRSRTKALLVTLSLAAVAAAYISSISHVKALPRQKAAEEINVAISPIVQIVLAAGDTFLASNLATFRATIVAIQSLNSSDYPILAKIQDDASRLNPAQEDNYYIAQGILPWIGEYNAAINILDRATQARPDDFLPPYFLGFNYMYFEGKFEEAGRYYRLAADRAGGKNRDILLNNAAKFMEKGKDPATAIQFIRGLIKSTRNQGLQQFLRARIVRLERLIILREAATRYQQQYKHPPKQLNDLVESGILQALPTDPLGVGYRLDEHGVPQIIFQIRRFN
jgi:tetratricopeptide (TPR) repeat protein